MSSFIVPRTTYHGPGSIENLKTVKGTKAVIVTGAGSMKKFGFVDKAIALLKEAGIASVVFDGVESDPSVKTVKRGLEVFNREEPDVIVGLGGCSAIDAAKAMWIFYEYPDTTFEQICQPFTVKPLRNKAHFVAIPSTSGTGTEVTCAAIITDTDTGIKHPVVTYEICPDLAIVDANLCLSMPPHITANTGMDALSHDVEAFVAVLASLYSDAVAVESVKLIFENLPKAVADGSNLEVRQVMHDASCLGGIAFSNAILGIVHSMSHQLGGTFGVAHGRANTILMPNVIRFNSRATGKYEQLAQLLGKKTAEEFAQAVAVLGSSVGIEPSFKAYGISQKDWDAKLDAISAHALADPCTGTNPRKPTLEEIKKIYQCCYNGTVVDF
ncbi:MAG TPA: iron-containing alcohol dehydrogenase [Candidatus Saccharimonadales bacterium]|nr:iron-containing alcohol dehydrogenase [Candidatus Saccharimonadales bacterium]